MSEENSSKKIADALLGEESVNRNTTTSQKEEVKSETTEKTDETVDNSDEQTEEKVEKQEVVVDKKETTEEVKAEAKEEIKAKAEVIDEKEEKVEAPQVDFEKISEELGMEVSSYEDVFNAYKSLKESTENRDPFIKQLEEYRSKGIKITPDFLSQVSINWAEKDPSKSADAYEIIKAHTKIDNPDLSDAELSYLMEDYEVDWDAEKAKLEDQYEEDEAEKRLNSMKERFNAKLSIKARKLKPELEKYQGSLAQEDAKSPEEIQAELEEVRQGFFDNVNKVTKDFTTYKETLGGLDVEVPIDKDVLKEIRQDMKDLVYAPEKFYAKHDNINGLREMVTFLNLKQKIGESLINVAKAEGGQEVAKKMKNQEAISEGTKVVRGSTQSKAIADAMEASLNE